MKLVELTQFLDRELNLEAFRQDHSNNGLQVEGSAEVRRAAFAVDACLATFELAAEKGVDFLFVHHGLSWGAEPRRFTGVTARRLRTLFNAGISLYAAHLPLDANPEFGHNIQMARLLGLEKIAPFGWYDGYRIGFAGQLRRMAKVEDVAELLNEKLPSEGDLSIVGESSRKVKKIGVISGGGAFPALFSEMRAEGIDCLVTGEFTHQSYHYALETGISIIVLGHYRTEIPGVLAVRELVEEKFGIPCAFMDLPTGF